MSFKKNAFSYFIWIIFIMCNLVVFSFLSMMCAKALGGPMPFSAFGLAAAFFGVLFLIYFLTGWFSKKMLTKSSNPAKDRSIRRRLILEGILAVCILAAGVGLRVYLLPTAGEAAAYYDVAKVTQDSAALIVPVQNSVYYYLCLLHGIFMVFGNHWIAGIWVQVILQLLAGIVLYFVVRKMAGAGVALITLGYLMFVPSAVKSSLMYSPDMLYFLLWSVGLLFICLFLNSSMKSAEKEKAGYCAWMWTASFLVGGLVGFLTYVDVSGIVLMIPVLMLTMVFREHKKTLVWTGRMLLAACAAVGGFAGSIYLDGIFSNTSFLRVLNAWLMTFQPEIPDIVLLMQNSTIEVMILLVLMAVNIFSFYRRKDRDIITVWMLMIFVLAALYVMGITAESMNGRPLLLLLMCVSAAISLRELFQITYVEQKVTESRGEADSAATDEVAVPVISTEVVRAQIEKPRFIDNPLPLPKKHVKRTMDYAFVPDAAQMKYDIEISETDDFDV